MALAEDLAIEIRQQPFFKELNFQRRSSHNFWLEHSLFVTSVGFELLKKVDLIKKVDFMDFAMVALLHDSLLPPDVCTYEIDSFNYERQLQKLSQTAVWEYLEHPVRVYDILCKEVDYCSRRVMLAILQHHERPSGNGFPRRLRSSEIDLFSSVFIISHEFISKLYASQFEQSEKKKILLNLKAEFYGGNFSGLPEKLATILGINSL